MAKKLPPANHWFERELKDWNVSTYHAYLMHKHNEVIGIPYVPFRTWILEKAQLKNFINEVKDKEVVKNFIDTCFKEYKPKEQYPSLSFGFMYTYMRSNVLPKCYANQKKTISKEKYEIKQEKLSVDEMLDLL